MAGRRALDPVLLRRFGYVRAVGGATYSLAVAVLFGIYGTRVWPLALGVPVLAVVTSLYFSRSHRYPHTAVVVSLGADALVLGGAVAFLGGTGSGLVLLYAIVIVSAGLLLGPGAATGFTAVCVGLSLLQLAAEQLGYPPVLLANPYLDERLPVLGVSLAGLISVGYLSATYASRLHELIGEADVAAETVRRRGRRRRSFVAQASVDVREPLRQLDEVADALDARWDELGEHERRQLTARLRMAVTAVDAEVGQLADVGAMDSADDIRPEVIALTRVVDDCVVQLAERLAAHDLRVDVPPLKVIGERRAARRVVFNLLENVVEHTPRGTRLHVTALTNAGSGVLVVTDDGPGIPEAARARLFDLPEAGGRRVGLPLVAELCAAMGARIRCEQPATGGSRFLVAFRLAPSAAPSADDERAGAEAVPP
ncbi:MAG: sensor histidine kinase [Euzebyales bacterium]|nr:sensor histidine kinase [Euzebyales bacterium]MBA3621819.1 sensor histidine kinase [Euzebyales bacterium]